MSFSNKWESRFMSLAAFVATWSKDPSTKVGACIVRPDKTIASVGFNGFPRGIKDDDRLDDRAKKYNCILHAEANAIFTAKENLSGYSLYVTPLPPCSKCALQIIQSGLSSVTVDHLNALPDRWSEDMDNAISLLKEAGVEVNIHRSHDAE